MSFHAGQTFTFGETPSATKWNYIWENDYALQDWSAFTNETFPVELLEDDSVGPDKRTGGFFVKVHTFANSTGSQSITGVGFKPKAIIVLGGNQSSVVGAVLAHGLAYDNAGSVVQNSLASTDNHSSNVGAQVVETTSLIHSVASAGTTTFRGILTSFDADGATFNITTASATQNTREYRLMFLA
jgi:hypothetical protein